MTGVQKSTRLNSSHTIISYAWSSDVCSSDRKSTRLNSSHTIISYDVFCLKNKIESASATAYFYLDKPASNLKALAPAEERVKFFFKLSPRLCALPSSPTAHSPF